MKQKTQPVNSLMEAFDFTVDDLEANREGLLGDDQRERLEHHMTNRRTMTLLGIGAVLFLVVIFGLLPLRMVFREMGTATGILLLGGLGIHYFIRKTMNTVEDDLRDGIVEEIDGTIKLDIGGSSGYVLAIDDRTFPLTYPQFLAFKNYDPYRVYYLPRSRRIVSVEWLR